MRPPKLTDNHALFFDFDGVLAEIVPKPDDAWPIEGIREELARLEQALNGAVAVVSGRMLADVSKRIAPLVLAGSGSHGNERRRADGTLEVPSDEVRQQAADIAKAVQIALNGEQGIFVEVKDWSVGTHYRAAPEKGPLGAAALNDAVVGREGWEVTSGKMIFEARPKGVSKADPVNKFMAEPPFAGRVPIFVGDDLTDEDGMKAAEAHGGFGIRVGEGESVARYRLDDPQDVLNYLKNQLI